MEAKFAFQIGKHTTDFPVDQYDDLNEATRRIENINSKTVNLQLTNWMILREPAACNHVVRGRKATPLTMADSIFNKLFKEMSSNDRQVKLDYIQIAYVDYTWCKEADMDSLSSGVSRADIEEKRNKLIKAKKKASSNPGQNHPGIFIKDQNALNGCC